MFPRKAKPDRTFGGKGINAHTTLGCFNTARTHELGANSTYIVHVSTPVATILCRRTGNFRRADCFVRPALGAEIQDHCSNTLGI